MLSPLLYSLFTNDCVATPTSHSFIKFADNTIVAGLITNNEETAYRKEVRALGEWCQENNPLTQCQQNKGADHGLQETAEGARPYPHRRDQSGEGGSYSAYTSLTIYIKAIRQLNIRN